MCSFAWVRQPVKEKENSEFKPVVITVKTDVESHPAYGRGVRSKQTSTDSGFNKIVGLSKFQTAIVSIMLYGWTLTKRMEKKLDGNYTRMLRAIFNKSWRQHPTKQQLYGHLPPVTKTIQVRRTRHAGHCCRSRDELMSDVLIWTLSHGRAKAGRPAQTYIQQLCEDTRCSPGDLLEVMNDREKW